MFFVVISLAGSIVREKSSGSFIRLKTLPTNYFIGSALKTNNLSYRHFFTGGSDICHWYLSFPFNKPAWVTSPA
jgi:hypothetical protein